MSVVSFEIGLLTPQEAIKTIKNELTHLMNTREAKERVNPAMWRNLDSKIEITVPVDRNGFTHQTANVWCQDTWLANAIRGKNFDGTDRVKVYTELAPVSDEVLSMTPAERAKWENEIISRPVKNYIIEETTEYVVRDASGKIVERYHYEEDDISEFVVVLSVVDDETDYYRVRVTGDTEEWYRDDEPDVVVRRVNPDESELQITSEYVEIDDPQNYPGVQVLNLGGGWAAMEDLYASRTITEKLPPLFNPVFNFGDNMKQYIDRLRDKYNAAVKQYPEKLKEYQADQDRARRTRTYPKLKEPKVPQEPVYPPIGAREIALEVVPTRYISDLIGESASKQSTHILQCTRLPPKLNVGRLLAYLHSVYDKYSWNNRTTNGQPHVAIAGAESFPRISYGHYKNKDDTVTEAVVIAYRPGYDDGRDALICHRFLEYEDQDRKVYSLAFGHPYNDISDNFTTQPAPTLVTGARATQSPQPNRGGYSSPRGGRGRGR